MAFEASIAPEIFPAQPLSTAPELPEIPDSAQISYGTFRKINDRAQNLGGFVRSLQAYLNSGAIEFAGNALLIDRLHAELATLLSE